MQSETEDTFPGLTFVGNADEIIRGGGGVGDDLQGEMSPPGCEFED